MKRRTRTSRTPIGYEHRLAFDHAFRIFGLKDAERFADRKKTHHRGKRIRFAVEILTETGQVLKGKFSCTLGFRFELDRFTMRGIEPHPDNKRHLHARLAAYRERLLASQQVASDPITFRHFCLLISALGYNASPNP